jgi:hypothetical protein
MLADHFLTEHSSALAADTSGSRSSTRHSSTHHSSSRGRHSTAKSTAGCCCTPVRLSASSRFQQAGCFQSPTMAAGLHERTVLPGCHRSGDRTMRCQIPAARGHDPSHFLALTSFATRCCPDGSATHCHSPMRVH